jgi:hypothetical protein
MRQGARKAWIAGCVTYMCNAYSSIFFNSEIV